ncbi:hypothetical protein KY345_02740 [Candidatus Woesearchaeota archaeon]|nr:hypothetical protein [Candidatus Woesearchaeota archaeon]
MKKILSIILFLLFPAYIYAATTQSLNMEYDETVVIAGRNITLDSVSHENVYLDVDGSIMSFPIEINETKEGVKVSVGLIYDGNKYRNFSIDLTITVYYTCGNGNCEAGEDKFNCCLDCECSDSYSCYKNKCYNSDLVECFSDSDCNDNDSCTIDSCGGSPVIKCTNARVIKCKHNDTCCPIGCEYIEDNDCAAKTLELESTTLGECQVDSDCDDNNNATVDKCVAATNICHYYAAPTEEAEEDKTVLIQEEKPCRTDSDCNDDNANTVDKCDEIGKVCYYIPSEEANQITGAVTAEAEWNSEKKEKNFFVKFFDWLLGLFQK